MGNRISKVITRTGDDGTTGLGDGSRTPKHSARIQAIGDIDELNSALGLTLTETLPTHIAEALLAIQSDLFDLGGELSCPGMTLITEHQIETLEKIAQQSNAQLSPLREFILPGGTRAAALTHLARTIARRAERKLTYLATQEPINPITHRYLNRLSDLLFIIARYLNQNAGVSDQFWKRHKNTNSPPIE